MEQLNEASVGAKNSEQKRTKRSAKVLFILLAIVVIFLIVRFAIVPSIMIKTGNYKSAVALGRHNIKIPQGTTSIEAGAFRDCTGLISVEIPASVTSIGNEAFKGCVDLSKVTFAENSQVTSIGDSAFYLCGKLTSITIPSSVTRIGNQAFSAPTGAVNAMNLKNVLFEKDSHLVSIGEYAFYHCNELVGIQIPASVASIGDGAFYECKKLSSVTFEVNSQLTSIGNSVFYMCVNLTSISIPSNVTSIGYNAFAGGGIGYDPFTSGYTSYMNLKSVIFEKNSKLTVIGNSAFAYCDKLVRVEIPSNVTSIDSDAFWGCSNLTSVTFEGNSQLISIGSEAFEGCGLTSVQIPANVTSIDKEAFSGCYHLESVTFVQTTGWYRTQTKSATSGTSMSVTNAGTNATNLVSNYKDYYWYRK